MEERRIALNPLALKGYKCCLKRKRERRRTRR